MRHWECGKEERSLFRAPEPSCVVAQLSPLFDLLHFSLVRQIGRTSPNHRQCWPADSWTVGQVFAIPPPLHKREKMGCGPDSASEFLGGGLDRTEGLLTFF